MTGDQAGAAWRDPAASPGAGTTVTFRLGAEDVAAFDEQSGRWTVHDGLYELLVGRSSRDLRPAGRFPIRDGRLVEQREDGEQGGLMRRVVAVLGVVLATLVTGCADAGPGTGPAVSTPTGSPSVAGPGGAATASRPAKVLTIVEENHGEQAALAQMPYLAALSAAYGRTSAYRAVAHPSLPNYLALVGGSTFGVTDDAPPAAHPLPGPSVFDQAISAGRTAKAYIEAMPSPCALSSSGRYAVRHNPWTYFADPAERAHCQAQDVPAGTPSAGPLHDDVTAGTLPTLGWVTPDLCNDAHDCPARVADDWLRSWLPAIMGGPDFLAGRLAVVVTFDEAEGSGGNTVLTTLIAPGVRHVVSATSCSHYCWTRYAAELAGTPPLRQAAGSTSLGTAFGFG